MKLIDNIQWYNKNTRSLLVQNRLSLEKHEPENADQFWKTTVVEGISGILTFGFVLYVVLKNAGNIGTLKQQQVDLVMKSDISYPMSAKLLPI